MKGRLSNKPKIKTKMNNKNFQFKDSEFIKSSMSRGSRKQCVEVAINNNGIGVRDSKDKTK